MERHISNFDQAHRQALKTAVGQFEAGCKKSADVVTMGIETEALKNIINNEHKSDMRNMNDLKKVIILVIINYYK